MPTVSIILATYNRGHLLDRSIKSVLNQTYQDYELIIVDDGSTDDTEKLVQNFNSEKIKYIKHKKNKGNPTARNTGIRLAEGDYIAFQDDDDEWMPEKLERQINAYINEPPEVGVVYSQHNSIDIHNDPLPQLKVAQREGYIFGQLLNENHIPPQTSLIRKECFSTVGMFDERFLRMQDWELFLRISQHYRFKFIDEPLVTVYDQPGGQHEKFERIIVSLKRVLDMYCSQIKQDRKTLAKYYYRIANLSCTIGKLNQGRLYFLKSLRAYPLDIVIIGAFLVSLLGDKTYNTIAAVYRKRRILFYRIRKALRSRLIRGKG